MKNIIPLLLVLLLVSCQNDTEYVRFETAQPSGTRALDNFSKTMRGEYVSCSDSSNKLWITADALIQSSVFKLKAHRNDLELDSTLSIDIYDDIALTNFLEQDSTCKVTFQEDSLLLAFTQIDTIFLISEHQQLKKAKKDYFLNFQKGKSHWEIKQLSLADQQLSLASITPSDSLLHLDFATKSEEMNEKDSITTTEYLLSPSKQKELHTLVKAGLFNDRKCYYKK